MDPSSPTIVRGNIPLTLAESLDRLSKNRGRGWFTDIRIQKEVINFIADECGSDITKYVDPKNTLFVLNPILERAREKYIPYMTSTRTIRRWFVFFIEHRVTMAEQRNEFLVKRRRCTRNGARNGRNKQSRVYFSDSDIDALKWCVI